MLNKYFPSQKSKIAFEGPGSKNPFAFTYYDKDKKVGGRTMGEHLRFSIAYWHTFMGGGADMFGGPSFRRPWHQAAHPMDRAKETMEAAFEFFAKLGIDYFCFHDRDIAPEGGTFAESCKNLESMVQLSKTLQQESGVKVLWGTANLFSNPLYAQGAATSPNANVAARAAAQVKNALDATKELGGENYVFWGGREGYESLLNTDLKREQEQLARFLHLAVEYKKSIGFKGQFLIEPKPAEPTKHQYDFDSATTLGFLREYGLFEHFKLNIEANHASLAGHTFEHELAVASAAGKLGSVDANRGDLMLGWDTDQFPMNLYDTTYAMLIILRQQGLGTGGLNFDAKVRRSSTDEMDLFHAHIGGMDAFARGLLIAQQIIDDGVLDGMIKERYASHAGEAGKQLSAKDASLAGIDRWVRAQPDPVLQSSRQELFENIVNRYL